MDEQVRVVWDDVLTEYDFGPQHPMSPIRLELTAKLASTLGLFDLPNVDVVSAQVAGDDVLASVHDPEYIQAVKDAGRDPATAPASSGISEGDTPAFPRIHEASARIFQAAVDCADAVADGSAAHAVNFCGGLHHAMRDRAAGFCVYNDLAGSIQRLLDRGFERVAYIDIDVHHGDGTEAIFWNDPRVMTISIHESGRILFPGTGHPDDIGGSQAMGESVNVALPPHTSDEGWLRSLHAIVAPLVQQFKPQVLVTQHGADTHASDPLAHFEVTLDAQRLAAEFLHNLAHQHCQGRWLASGGGGYEVVNVVPRTWAHLIGIAAHHPVPPFTETPQAWREFVLERTGVQGPTLMTDGADPWWQPWEVGYDPQNSIDRAIMATRKAIFPLHALDPWFD